MIGRVMRSFKTQLYRLYTSNPVKLFSSARNSLTSQEVIDFVKMRIDHEKELTLQQICEELFDHCLAPHTMGDGTGCDNMTCIIVRYYDQLRGEESRPRVRGRGSGPRCGGRVFAPFRIRHPHPTK